MVGFKRNTDDDSDRHRGGHWHLKSFAGSFDRGSGMWALIVSPRPGARCARHGEILGFNIIAGAGAERF